MSIAARLAAGEADANERAALRHKIERLRSALRAVTSDLSGELHEHGVSQKERDEWPSIVLAKQALAESK